MDKLVFALIVSAKRLMSHFQTHIIIVLTEYPLKKVLQKLDISRRLVNWEIELGEFDLKFHPTTTIKGQALADFLVEFYNFLDGETWAADMDGSATQKRSGTGVVLVSPKEKSFEFVI
jgi:hypothetical protein